MRRTRYEIIRRILEKTSKEGGAKINEIISVGLSYVQYQNYLKFLEEGHFVYTNNEGRKETSDKGRKLLDKLTDFKIDFSVL